MGPATRVSRPAFHGYYDGHEGAYLGTDVWPGRYGTAAYQVS